MATTYECAAAKIHNSWNKAIQSLCQFIKGVIESIQSSNCFLVNFEKAKKLINSKIFSLKAYIK